MAKLLSNTHADELPAIFETVRNIQQATRGRPNRRDRGGQGGGGTEFGLCTITGDGANDQQYLVNVVLGNPNDNADPVTGILFLNNATVNPVSVGAQIMAITYSSTTENISLDCFPVETIYNLVTPPDEE